MVKYDFKNPEEFARLKKLAYDGQLDFNDFPAAEYRFFDRIQDIGYRVRCEGFPMDFAIKDCRKAEDDYLRDVEEKQRCISVYGEYQREAIRKGQLLKEITSERSPILKLRLALEFVGIVVGDKDFANYNMSHNHLDCSCEECGAVLKWAEKWQL